MRALRTAALLLLTFTATAEAQAPADDGMTGRRVRVTAPNFAEHRVTGTVAVYTDQRLVVDEEATGRRFDFPLRAVQRLDPFLGGGAASTAWYRGRLGAFVGAAVGLVAGAAIASSGDGDMVQPTLIAGAAGLGAGALIGAAHGAAFPRERWGWVMAPWGYDPALRPSAGAP